MNRCPDEIWLQKEHAAVLVGVGMHAESLRVTLAFRELIVRRRAGYADEPHQVHHHSPVLLTEVSRRIVECAIVRRSVVIVHDQDVFEAGVAEIGREIHEHARSVAIRTG